MEVRLACRSAMTLELDAMHELQGDLKELSKENYARLKNEISETGFAFAPHVWSDGSKWFLVDGHQRRRVLQKMREEGWRIPPIPVVPVEARDLKEAKRRVLQGTSQYGEMTEDGLYEFMNASGLALPDIEAFRLPDIDTEHFKDNFFEDPPTDKDDDVPEIPKEAKTKRGELWILGNHRLLIDDCTVKENVERLMSYYECDCGEIHV